MKQKELQKLSLLVSLISLCLGMYWRYYPQTIWLFTVEGVPQSIDSSMLVPILFIIGLISLVKRK